MFNNGFGFGSKHLFYRENNYSNSEVLINKRKGRERRNNNSKDDIINERMLNFSTENGAVADHKFFNQSEDYIGEDVHSFINRHLKIKQNIKDSYLYDENNSTSVKRNLVKDDSRKRAQYFMNNEYSQDSKNSKNSYNFITVSGNKYDYSQDLQKYSKNSKHFGSNSLKLTKVKSMNFG